MKDQHTKIKGYRDLSQVEIDLMNRVKSLGVEIESLISEVQEHLNTQALNAVVKESDPDEAIRIDHAQPGKWLESSKTDLQVGIMKLVRSIAQPGTF